MQYFSIYPTAANNAPKAVYPLFWLPQNNSANIPAGQGASEVTIFDGVAGTPAPYGGMVYKSNPCDQVLVKVSYIAGDDCNPCTATDNLLETGPLELLMDNNVMGLELPPGYISNINVQIVATGNAPTNSLNGNIISFSSSRAPLCGSEVNIPA